jgi:hypothetical protein
LRRGEFGAGRLPGREHPAHHASVVRYQPKDERDVQVFSIPTLEAGDNDIRVTVDRLRAIQRVGDKLRPNGLTRTGTPEQRTEVSERGVALRAR